jgi:hypothetical protein
MTFLETVEQAPYVLTDGGIETRIVYEFHLAMDPQMEASRLVYDERGREVLQEICGQCLDRGTDQRHIAALAAALTTR